MKGGQWLMLSLLAFTLMVGAFGLLGWWIVGKEESKLDDGDPNNPYYDPKRHDHD